MRTRVGLGWLALLSALSVPARADGDETEPVDASNDDAADAADDDDAHEPPPPPYEPSPLPIVAAVVPGVLVQGAGNFVAGRPTAALRVGLMQVVGGSLATSGAVTLAATGANRVLAGPAAVATITGGGLLAIGLLTDLTSVATPDGGTGSPDVRVPMATTEVGWRAISDPQFDYGNLLVESVDLRIGSFQLKPSGWFALDDRNARLRMLAAYRTFGASPGRPGSDGSFLDLGAAVTHHGYFSDGFRTLTGEVFVNFRLDMARMHDAFEGSFGELGTGIALAATDFDGEQQELGDDLDSLLLGRFAFGLYLGDGTSPNGELSVFYDHRHDGYVGGAVGFGVGFVGHVGLGGTLFLTDELGLRSDIRQGAATVAGLSLLVRSRPAAASATAVSPSRE